MIYIALGTQITRDEVMVLNEVFQADPLSIKTVKALKIARLEEKLAEAKKA